MDVNIINLKEKAALIRELHAYKRIAGMNGYDFKLVKAQREFVWHRHPDTDEVFYAVEGGFEIHLREKVLTLKEGDMVVIPKNAEHKPVCKSLCTILLIEPKGTLNTGDAGGALTDTLLEDI
ncbi:MAG: cupin [Desulfobacterales bacterium RIFOXYA12_FULL_46_15]|nr:MAG: cupin [Desulfobacula sp. GWF2_41_7]OGR25390.1 MAG: cupin [Desulfobacterales bacterium RIFOXYA12_FULL_46_15]